MAGLEGGGVSPHWRDDGKELYYTNAGQLMAVNVTTQGDACVPGTPKELFRAAGIASLSGVSRDGRRFLMLADEGEEVRPLKVIVNWQALIRK